MRRLRRTPVNVSITIPELDSRFEAVHARMDELLPRIPAPDGFRWKTRAEYRVEYNDVGTTAARRIEILAILHTMRPRETVAL